MIEKYKVWKLRQEVRRFARLRVKWSEFYYYYTITYVWRNVTGEDIFNHYLKYPKFHTHFRQLVREYLLDYMTVNIPIAYNYCRTAYISQLLRTNGTRRYHKLLLRYTEARVRKSMREFIEYNMRTYYITRSVEVYRYLFSIKHWMIKFNINNYNAKRKWKTRKERIASRIIKEIELKKKEKKLKRLENKAIRDRIKNKEYVWASLKKDFEENQKNNDKDFLKYRAKYRLLLLQGDDFVIYKEKNKKKKK